MQIIVDLNNPEDVANALALLGGNTGAAPATPAAASRPGPAAAPARAAGPAANKPAPAAAAAKPAPAKPAPAAAQSSKLAQMAEAIAGYAKAYGPKETKARFGQMSEALTAEYGQEIAFTKTSDIAEDWVDICLPWFEVAAE